MSRNLEMWTIWILMFFFHFANWNEKRDIEKKPTTIFYWIIKCVRRFSFSLTNEKIINKEILNSFIVVLIASAMRAANKVRQIDVDGIVSMHCCGATRRMKRKMIIFNSMCDNGIEANVDSIFTWARKLGDEKWEFDCKIPAFVRLPFILWPDESVKCYAIL